MRRCWSRVDVDAVAISDEPWAQAKQYHQYIDTQIWAYYVEISCTITGHIFLTTCLSHSPTAFGFVESFRVLQFLFPISQRWQRIANTFITIIIYLYFSSHDFVGRNFVIITYGLTNGHFYQIYYLIFSYQLEIFPMAFFPPVPFYFIIFLFVLSL